MRNEKRRGYYLLKSFASYPGHSSRSNSLSNVISLAFRTIAVAATIQSGSLSLMARRRAMVSFFTSLVVRKITAFVSNTKRFSVIPFGPKFSLVSYSVTKGVRGKNSEIPGDWLAVLFGNRSKGNDGSPCRYFTGYINYETPANRDIYCLCNTHGLNIA